jgi:rSAM/selenodomain-associated transferase 2
MIELSIVMPVLNEAADIAETLQALAPSRARGVEVVVVDGGSGDATVAQATPLADRVVLAPRGRAAQMNAGAACARGQVLLFLHADTRLPADADRMILASLAWSRREWGRFDVKISGRSALLPVIALSMNLRSRLTGIATGDQSIFVRRQAFEEVGGFPDVALMEDIALSKQLKRHGRPLCIGFKAITSGRRWDENGVIVTMVTMWGLRLAYYLGAQPALLARFYRDAGRNS